MELPHDTVGPMGDGIPIGANRKRRLFLMLGNHFYKIHPLTTKHRFRGKYRLEVREDDHPPMHVHLIGADVDVVISLETLQITHGQAPSMLLNEALEWIHRHRVELIEEWKKWHD